MMESNQGFIQQAAPWACPVCRQGLRQEGRQFRCGQGHVFDVAREGYVNLLLANQKHSAEPGDAGSMLRNRREFLQQGHYLPLAEGLIKHMQEVLDGKGDAPFSLLDIGCGEGYYTGAIAGAIKHAGAVWAGGVDISKEAVRMAAKRYRDVQFAVASSTRLPLLDRRLDCLMRIFAPGDEGEVRRVLKAGGLYIRVTPGARHLYSLRQLIYDRPSEHDTAALHIEGFQRAQRHTIDYAITVQGEGNPGRLLSMTPYYWQTGEEKQAYIEALDRLDTEVSFCLDCFRRL